MSLLFSEKHPLIIDEFSVKFENCVRMVTAQVHKTPRNNLSDVSRKFLGFRRDAWHIGPVLWALQELQVSTPPSIVYTIDPVGNACVDEHPLGQSLDLMDKHIQQCLQNSIRMADSFYEYLGLYNLFQSVPFLDYIKTLSLYTFLSFHFSLESFLKFQTCSFLAVVMGDSPPPVPVLFRDLIDMGQFRSCILLNNQFDRKLRMRMMVRIRDEQLISFFYGLTEVKKCALPCSPVLIQQELDDTFDCLTEDKTEWLAEKFGDITALRHKIIGVTRELCHRFKAKKLRLNRDFGKKTGEEDFDLRLLVSDQSEFLRLTRLRGRNSFFDSVYSDENLYGHEECFNPAHPFFKIDIPNNRSCYEFSRREGGNYRIIQEFEDELNISVDNQDHYGFSIPYKFEIPDSLNGYFHANKDFIDNCKKKFVKTDCSVEYFKTIELTSPVLVEIRNRGGRLSEIFGYGDKDYHKTIIRNLKLRRSDSTSCRLVGLPEPFKVRVISKGEVLNYWVARGYQKLFWDLLKGSPVFQLAKGPLKEYMINSLIEGNPFRGSDCRMISGDFKGATNYLHPGLSSVCQDIIMEQLDIPDNHRGILRQCLTGHEIVHRRFLNGTFVEQSRPQRWGQLMGGPLSFPILCIVNYAVTTAIQEQVVFDNYLLGENFKNEFINFVKSGKEKPSTILSKVIGLPKEGDAINALVNGDDILFPLPPTHYQFWVEQTSAAGLIPSVGKNFTNSNYCTVNSTLVRLPNEWFLPRSLNRPVFGSPNLPTYWDVHSDSAFRRDHRNRSLSCNLVKILPTIKLHLIYSNGRGLNRIVEDEDDYDKSSMSARFERLIWGLPTSVQTRLMTLAIRQNLSLLKKFVAPNISYFNSPHCSGLGFPLIKERQFPPGDVGVALKERYFANMKKHGLIASICMCDYTLSSNDLGKKLSPSTSGTLVSSMSADELKILNDLAIPEVSGEFSPGAPDEYVTPLDEWNYVTVGRDVMTEEGRLSDSMITWSARNSALLKKARKSRLEPASPQKSHDFFQLHRRRVQLSDKSDVDLPGGRCRRPGCLDNYCFDRCCTEYTDVFEGLEIALSELRSIPHDILTSCNSEEIINRIKEVRESSPSSVPKVVGNRFRLIEADVSPRSLLRQISVFTGCLEKGTFL